MKNNDPYGYIGKIATTKHGTGTVVGYDLPESGLDKATRLKIKYDHAEHVLCYSIKEVTILSEIKERA